MITDEQRQRAYADARRRGLPDKVTDPNVLDRIAAIFRLVEPDRRKSKQQRRSAA